MFFSKKFINHDNISTIQFYETNNRREYIIKKVHLPEVSDKVYWKKEKYKNEYILLDDSDSFGTTRIELSSQNDKEKTEWENSLYKILETANEHLAYEDNYGEIHVTVIMNNKDKIEGNIKPWGKTHYVEDGVLVVNKDIKKDYSDDLDIEEVYSLLLEPKKKVSIG